jgi:hypothetical protein
MSTTQPTYPARRAFVVQIHVEADVAHNDVWGRVEHIVSGQVTHFMTIERWLCTPCRNGVTEPRKRRILVQMRSLRFLLALALCAAGIAAAQPTSMGDPLPSWNDREAKSAIIGYVKRVTVKDSPDFVPVAERIATFDNDGTLWSEQPVYFQGRFALDRVRAMAADHPEWHNTEPFKSVIAGDMKGLMATGKEGLEKVLLATHANMTAAQFEASVRDCSSPISPAPTSLPCSSMILAS